NWWSHNRMNPISLIHRHLHIDLHPVFLGHGIEELGRVHMPVWMESFSFGNQGPGGPSRKDHTGAHHDLVARRCFLMAAEAHHSQNSLPAVNDVENRKSAPGLEALAPPPAQSTHLDPTA